jgi:hypothetical protein
MPTRTSPQHQPSAGGPPQGTHNRHAPARLALLLPWGRWERHPYRPTAEHLSHVQAEASFVRHVLGLGL